MSLCPCGSSRDYDECCGPIIGGTPAPTAEALMRSRYSAFVTRQLDHVLRTQSAEISAEFNREEIEQMAEECEWQGLEVRSASESGDCGEVEFVIRFRSGQQNLTQVERSAFRRKNGQWLYVGGEINPQPAQRHVSKVGRNDPCPCGSGKKAKKCCGTTRSL